MKTLLGSVSVCVFASSCRDCLSRLSSKSSVTDAFGLQVLQSLHIQRTESGVLAMTKHNGGPFIGARSYDCPLSVAGGSS